MKALKIFCMAVLGAAAISLVQPIEAAVDPSGIFTPAGPGSLDLGDNLISSFNSVGSVGRGLPLTVTNTAAVAATNVVVPIIQGSDLAFQFYFGSLPTNSAATSNLVWRFVASADNGKHFTSQPWLTLSTAQQGSNTPVVNLQLVGNTNFSGVTHLKLLTVSNTMTVGAGPMYVTNLTVTQKRRGIRVN